MNGGMPRWKKRLIVALSIPVVLALIGWLGLVLAERRIDDEIHVQELRMAKFGVRTSAYRVEEDARADYRAAVEAMSGATWPLVGDGKDAEGVMRQVEEASRKPFFGDGAPSDDTLDTLTRVFDWCSSYIVTKARAHNWAETERGLEALERLSCQVIRSESELVSFWAGSSFWNPSDLLITGDRETQIWLRKMLEKQDSRNLLAARLSRLGRLQRQALRGPGPKLDPSVTKSDPWWFPFVERHGLFRKVAEARLMKSLADATEKIMRVPNHRQDLEEVARWTFKNDESWPAKWARRRMTEADPVPTGDEELERRISLIELDLMEAIDAHRPPVPTWSKPYAVDPGSGAPIQVKVLAGELTVSCYHSNGGFSRSAPFPPQPIW